MDIITPSRRVLRWQLMERGVFIHFGMNTFYNREWGDGAEDPARFAPSALDAGQWARLAREAGFRYMVLTAKHHDGFCLWPTRTTAHSVAGSPFKGGRGDVVREFTDACRREGLAAGLYLSPWDRNAPCYADPAAYDDFYAAQLTELLTGYGELSEIWFDGAGSAGRAYDWERVMALVRRHQPEVVVFNMGRPDIRWVGNEEGLAPYPCWNRAQAARQSMYTADMEAWLPGTPEWVPAECDVPIRRMHWFWHPDDEGSLRSLEDLIDIYERSVGRGCNLLLNVTPDDRGLIPEADAARLLELGRAVAKRYSAPLAAGGPFDGDTAQIAFPRAALSRAILREDIAHGERVRSFVLEGLDGGRATTLFTGSAVGRSLIVPLGGVPAEGLRLRVLASEGFPRVNALEVFTGPQT